MFEIPILRAYQKLAVWGNFKFFAADLSFVGLPGLGSARRKQIVCYHVPLVSDTMRRIGYAIKFL